MKIASDTVSVSSVDPRLLCMSIDFVARLELKVHASDD